MRNNEAGYQKSTDDIVRCVGFFLKVPVLALALTPSQWTPLWLRVLESSYLLFFKHISFSQYLHCIDMACIFLLDQPHLECKNSYHKCQTITTICFGVKGRLL